ncbi:hypothetical protein EB795_23195 [Pseudomonas mandelii]|nr:hypothetical protein [Pseudomonas mandelii]
MSWFERSMGWLMQEEKTKVEQQRERSFIASVSALKTLQVTPEGGMAIDPQEIRERVIECRHALRHLVRRP